MLAYPSMKDSGVWWIGPIPQGWALSKLKYVSEFAPKVSSVFNKDSPVGYVPMDCVRNGYMIPREALLSEMETGLVRFQEGDIVMAKVTPCFENGNIAIGSGLSQRIAFGSSELFVFRSSTIDQRYLFYYLQTQGFKQMCAATMTGTAGLKRVSAYFVRNAPIPVPTTSDQQRISSYLDDCCARIDTAIAEAKASIGEYKLLRQSVITQAVTKGLSPNAPMKHSGVEWIGEIPLTWNRGNLKVLFSFGRGLPITKADLTEDGVLVVSYGQIHAKTNTGTCLDDSLLRHVASSYLNTNVGSLIYNGDIVFADTSEDLEGMGNAVLMDRHEAVFAGYHTIVARPNDKTMSTYLAYLFRSDPWRSQLRSRATGIKVFSITQRMLKSCTVILPPEPDRSAIVSYLNSICARIDGLISEKQSMTSDLEAYKKSLIYEVVTGKRRVA